jgi:hypothetical protein
VVTQLQTSRVTPQPAPTTVNIGHGENVSPGVARQIHIEHQHVAENAKTVGDPDHFARKLRKNMTAHAGGIR